MIVQAIGLLDDLDKELNTYAMRVREWYGWHFPEMTKIVADNIKYAKAVRRFTISSLPSKLSYTIHPSAQHVLHSKSRSQLCCYCSCLVMLLLIQPVVGLPDITSQIVPCYVVRGNSCPM